MWFENVFVQYGFLSKLHSGNGGNFENKAIKTLCDIANMKKTRPIPYHHMHMGKGKFVWFTKKKKKNVDVRDNDKNEAH